jgi:hypothetical protein
MIHTRSRRSSRKGSWFTLAAAVLPLNIQKLTIAGTDNPVASYLAETPANRLAMTFTRRHAQVCPYSSLRHHVSDGRLANHHGSP